MRGCESHWHITLEAEMLYINQTRLIITSFWKENQNQVDSDIFHDLSLRGQNLDLFRLEMFRYLTEFWAIISQSDMKRHAVDQAS